MDDIPLDVLEKQGFEYVSILGSGGFGIVLKVRHKISYIKSDRELLI